MDEDARVEALELGLTQLTDAVESLTLQLQQFLPRMPSETVLEQVAHARRLLGTADDGELPEPEETVDGWVRPESSF